LYQGGEGLGGYFAGFEVEGDGACCKEAVGSFKDRGVDVATVPLSEEMTMKDLRGRRRIVPGLLRCV